MAGANSTIVVRVLGNTKGLSRSLRKANDQLGGLERISRGITTGMKAATVATLAFGAAAVGAAAIGAAALAAVPAAILGLGILAAAQSDRVKAAYSDMAAHVVRVFQKIAAPLEPVLVRGAGLLREAFDALVPSLTRIYEMGARLLDRIFRRLPALAAKIGPALESAFAAGVPVLMAFIRALNPILDGVKGFFDELGKSSGDFAAFAAALGKGLGALLPSLGRLIAALAPIGVVILQTVIPALVSLFDWIANNVGPAFEKFSGFLRDHKGAAKAVGIALVGLVVAVKAVQVAVAVTQAAVLAFTAVATIVRWAIIAWKNAQFALNLVMYANPIGLVIAAIVALVAIFVIAYKKSETFRNIVNKAWAGIKAATVSVWNFLKGLTLAVWNAIEGAVRSVVSGVKSAISSAWNFIKGATRAAWNVVKNTILVPLRVVIAVLRGDMGQAKAIVSGAWNFIKGATSRIWNSIKSAVRSAVSGLMSVVRSIPGKVKGAFSGAASWLYDAGKNVIRGLINGIKSMAGAAVDAAKGAVSGAISGAKNLLGIGSPSKVFRQFGRWTVEGLALGLKDTAGMAASAATGLARKVKEGFEAPQLSLAARPALATTGPATGNTYQISVEVPVGASAADTGREIVKAIEAYEKTGGRRRA